MGRICFLDVYVDCISLEYFIGFIHFTMIIWERVNSTLLSSRLHNINRPVFTAALELRHFSLYARLPFHLS